MSKNKVTTKHGPGEIVGVYRPGQPDEKKIVKIDGENKTVLVSKKDVK